MEDGDVEPWAGSLLSHLAFRFRFISFSSRSHLIVVGVIILILTIILILILSFCAAFALHCFRPPLLSPSNQRWS